MIPLGYELGTAKRVSVPMKNLAVLGQTQESGKTTTLEALITRSGLRAIAFVTKRGEKSFRKIQPIPPYFSESTHLEYWRFAASLMESMGGMKLGLAERAWLIRLCDEYKAKKFETRTITVNGKKVKQKSPVGYFWDKPENLGELLANVNCALPHLKGSNEAVLLQLREILKVIVPEVEDAKFSKELELGRNGIHVMDISKFSVALQALVIRSVVEWVYREGKKIVVIIPEAWQFIPQNRATPVKLAVEELIRKGSGLQNFVWIDSQDLRGVDKNIVRSVPVWLFGVQREKNEIANTLDSIPDFPRPTVTEVMRLQKGQFYVVYGSFSAKAYVQPAGMEDEQAISIAMGETDPAVWKEIEKDLTEQERQSAPEKVLEEPEPEPEPPAEWRQATESEDPVWKEKYVELKKQFDELTAQVATKPRRNVDIEIIEPTEEERRAGYFSSPPDMLTEKNESMDTIYSEIKKRALADPAMLLALDTQRPQLDVQITRHVTVVDATTLYGQIARLIGENFFDVAKNGPTVGRELKRRGNNQPTPHLYKPLNRLTEQGFLTLEADGYLAVKSMKVNLVDNGQKTKAAGK